MEIRTLTPADAAAFQDLRLQGLRECPSAFASSYEEEAPTPPAVIAERLLRREDRAVFGAFEDQELVGVLGLQREGIRKLAHKAFIWGMYVSPPNRRSGVGRALVVRALSFAASELRVRQVNLGVNANNVAAVALYERLGFTQFGFEHGFMLLDHEPQDEMHMVCLVKEAP